jgi:pyruvate/2-oxoglutarate dehydrogenase complex dihydrolipoamide dehydrogenase (E3) component
VTVITGSDRFDLLIIGAGQGGGPLASAAARTGRRVALVERAHVGGTCVNEGCSPTKTVIASARIAHLARRAGDYGVHGGATSAVSVDLTRVRERKQGIVDSFRTSGEQSLAEAGLEMLFGQARFTGPHAIRVSPSPVLHGRDAITTPRDIFAERIVINTGQRPLIPPVPGLERVGYLTSTSILDLTELPSHLIVLGGGYVGVELAQAWRRFGSRVTIIQRDDQLLSHEDADIADAVAAVLREDGIELLLGADATRVDQVAEGIRVRWRRRHDEGAGEQLTGSHLLVATGRRPNTDDLGLDAAGIAMDPMGYVTVDDALRTSADQVFAIGDVKGGPAFTHVSYDDFRVLRDRLLHGKRTTTAGRVIPYTVFIDPQLGAIGMTEREARAAGHQVRVARLPMSQVARALEVDETRGVIKAVVDADSAQILGARVLGLEGGEIATLFQLAMMGQLPYTMLRDAMFPHPTLGEALNNLFTAMDADG